jgi:ATP-dependent Clp protease protease subunit
MYNVYSSIYPQNEQGYSTQPRGYMPHIYEDTNGVEKAYDILSRLLKERIIILTGEFNEEMARSIVAQLLFLDSQNEKTIQIYINSGGGSIDSGMAIFDTMMTIKSPIHTIVNGLAASMGAFILSMGDERSGLPNSRIMIHQPLGGARGQSSDIQIAARQIELLKIKLAKYTAYKCKKDFEDVLKDMDRDNWMTAAEAKEYGLIDNVLGYKKDFPVF